MKNNSEATREFISKILDLEGRFSLEAPIELFDKTKAALEKHGFVVVCVEEAGQYLNDFYIAIFQALELPEWFNVFTDHFMLRELLMQLEFPEATGYIVMIRDVSQLIDCDAWDLLFWFKICHRSRVERDGQILKLVYPEGMLDIEYLNTRIEEYPRRRRRFIPKKGFTL